MKVRNNQKYPSNDFDLGKYVYRIVTDLGLKEHFDRITNDEESVQRLQKLYEINNYDKKETINKIYHSLFIIEKSKRIQRMEKLDPKVQRDKIWELNFDQTDNQTGLEEKKELMKKYGLEDNDRRKLVKEGYLLHHRLPSNIKDFMNAFKDKSQKTPIKKITKRLEITLGLTAGVMGLFGGLENERKTNVILTMVLLALMLHISQRQPTKKIKGNIEEFIAKIFNSTNETKINIEEMNDFYEKTSPPE